MQIVSEGASLLLLAVELKIILKYSLLCLFWILKIIDKTYSYNSQAKTHFFIKKIYSLNKLKSLF